MTNFEEFLEILELLSHRQKIIREIKIDQLKILTEKLENLKNQKSKN